MTGESEWSGVIEQLRARAAAAEAARDALHRSAVVPIGSAKTRKGRRSRDDRWAAVAAFRAALKEAYPSGFWPTMGARYERLARGEPDAVEMALLFLEADPWFFRSGYVKADLIRRVKRLCLTPESAERLRAVVIAAVDLRDRREFRRYCHLARAVDAPSLRRALAERRTSAHPGVRRRAEWMLASLEDRPVDPATQSAYWAWRDGEVERRTERPYPRLTPVPTDR